MLLVLPNHRGGASQMLAPYRVLDLTDQRGQLCGQILGDLGADVILVEPPGGLLHSTKVNRIPIAHCGFGH